MKSRVALALAAALAAVIVVVLVVLTGSSPDDPIEADFRREAPLETVMAPSAPPPTGDAVSGEKVFAGAGCGNCHTLLAVGSTGTIGPVLDGRSPSYERVLEQVVEGGGGMPGYRGTLSDEEIQDVVAFTLESIQASRSAP